ncbi:35420_t:CDS:2, partial [Gigaspora margarita]
LDDWNKDSFNINSELTVEQQNHVVDLLKETPQVYAKKISKSEQTVGLEQTNLLSSLQTPSIDYCQEFNNFSDFYLSNSVW